MYIAISLDGFIAKPDGNIDWLTEYGSQEELENDDSYKNFLDSVDALVMGGKTYRQVRTFGDWPYAEKRCVVVSCTETKSDLPGVSFTVDSPEKIVKILQNEGCRHVWIMGGGEIHSLFLRVGLIDEMRIFVIPKILGEGIPLFAPPLDGSSADVRWELLSHKDWHSNIVELWYRREPESLKRHLQ
ncbi:MAG: dihydrofolate reductase family protein [Planctomycetaceae bacterium]|nr:dihydrofolate reductase family protein [Planctomycetaceae bacterium]